MNDLILLITYDRDEMNEVESFEVLEGDNDSFNYTNNNLMQNSMNDSCVPRRINESRMSDITVDLKNLKTKSSLIESQILEKAKQIADLKNKVDEIDALDKNFENKNMSSDILSKIEEHMLALRSMQKGDFSTFPNFNIDEILNSRGEHFSKVPMDDMSSVPSTGQEETPPNGQNNRNERNIELTESTLQDNNHLREMIELWAQSKTSNQDRFQYQQPNVPNHLVKRKYK